MELDYCGSLSYFQRKLDEKGISFDVSTLAGATQCEIQEYVNHLLRGSKNNVNVIIPN